MDVEMHLEGIIEDLEAELTHLRAKTEGLSKALDAMTAERDAALEANDSLIKALSLIREKDLRVGGRTNDGVYHVDGELGRIAAAAMIEQAPQVPEEVPTKRVDRLYAVKAERDAMIRSHDVPMQPSVLETMPDHEWHSDEPDGWNINVGKADDAIKEPSKRE